MASASVFDDYTTGGVDGVSGINADSCRDVSVDRADWLFSSGCTCIRLEKNVGRMARRMGMDVAMSIFPRHIQLSLQKDERVFTYIATIHERCVSFDLNTRLSKLSWDMADGKLTFGEVCRKFDEIVHTSSANKWLVLLLASCANASFCRLFGGDAVAMCVVFLSTFAGILIKQLLAERHVDFRVTVMLCAFISTVLASADGLFGLGSTPQLTIGTSVLYLVPGIPFINSFCDMIDRHYICAFGRAMNAVVITGCLSLGLCLGMFAMNVSMFR